MNELIFPATIVAYCLLMGWHGWLSNNHPAFSKWANSVYGVSDIGERFAKEPLRYSCRILAIGATGWCMFFVWRTMQYVKPEKRL